MSRWLGPPIAVRALEKRGEADGKGTAELRIGRPRRAREGDYECRYEIHGFGSIRRLRVFGVDDVQALQLALVAVRADLQRLGREAVWLERPAYEGLSRQLPSYLPPKYMARIEAAADRAEKAFAKEARLRRARRRTGD